MSASFASAVPAAHDAAGSQDYPQATLYLVATPIGNLADVTLRALHVLSLVDAVACEDTRHTQGLLRSFGIERPLLALHQHNEQAMAQTIAQRLAQGERIAYVSDAGTPAVSDPGARLVACVQAVGLRVMPLPGASSITTAVSVAGLAGDGGFVFQGFLPARPAQRDAALLALAGEPRAVVLLEAPHRIRPLAQALAVLGLRPVTLARELTKQFEQVVTLPAERLGPWLAEDAQRERGEFVLVVHPVEVASQAGEPMRVLCLLMAELPVKTAVRLAAQITGAPRNGLYEQALALKQDAP